MAVISMGIIWHNLILLIDSLLWLYFEISYILSSTFIFVFLVYSVNYLERTSLVIWIKSYFTLQHPLIFLFYESSRNFQAVCLTFSCSLKSPFAISSFLSSIPLILLLLHHTYYHSPSLFVVSTSCPCLLPAGRASIDSISIELTSRMRFISLAPQSFLATRFGQPSLVCRAYFQTKNLRQMRQKMSHGHRFGFNRSIEKLWRISGVIRQIRISNYLKLRAVEIRRLQNESGVTVIQRFASRYLSAWFVPVLPLHCCRSSNYRYKTAVF